MHVRSIGDSGPGDGLTVLIARQLLKKRNHDLGKQRNENVNLANEDIRFEVECCSVDLMLWFSFYLRLFMILFGASHPKVP